MTTPQWLTATVTATSTTSGCYRRSSGSGRASQLTLTCRPATPESGHLDSGKQQREQQRRRTEPDSSDQRASKCLLRPKGRTDSDDSGRGWACLLIRGSTAGPPG